MKNGAKAYLARFWLLRQKWRLVDWFRFIALRYETAIESPTVMDTRANKSPASAVMMIPHEDIIEVDVLPCKEPSHSQISTGEILKNKNDLKSRGMLTGTLDTVGC